MKNKNMKRIIVLLILILIIGVSIKCCTHKDIDNSVFKNNEKTIESVQEEAKKDEEAKNSTESSKNNTSSENKSNSSSTSNKNNSSSNTGSSNSSSSGSGNKNNGSNSSSSSNTDGSSSSNSGSNNGGNSNKPSSGSNSAGNTSKPNSGSNNSNGGNSSNTEKPAHKHNWVNVTKTVNHPAETHQEDVYEDRQVKVKDAWDEKVWVKTLNVCNQCGYSTTSGSAMDEHLLEYGHSSSSKDIYETVHHDAVYETQRVKVGTKTVTDKAAWTETIVTGQKCSFCGETKTN